MPGYRKKSKRTSKPRRKSKRASKPRRKSKRVSRKPTRSLGPPKVQNLSNAGAAKDKVLSLLRSKNTKFYTILKGTNRPKAFTVNQVSNIKVKVWNNGMVVLEGTVAGGSKATRIVGRK